MKKIFKSILFFQNIESGLFNDSKNLNNGKIDLSKSSIVGLENNEAKSDLTSRLYKSELTSRLYTSESGKQSVRERQLLLLQKTGGINNNGK